MDRNFISGKAAVGAAVESDNCGRRTSEKKYAISSHASVLGASTSQLLAFDRPLDTWNKNVLLNWKLTWNTFKNSRKRKSKHTGRRRVYRRTKKPATPKRIYEWLGKRALPSPLSLPSSKSTFSQHFKDKIIEVARIGSMVILHLNKWWKATFSLLCDVIFLVRLQEKFEIDCSWEWKG